MLATEYCRYDDLMSYKRGNRKENQVFWMLNWEDQAETNSDPGSVVGTTQQIGAWMLT
jgi:hypothetical protein